MAASPPERDIQSYQNKNGAAGDYKSSLHRDIEPYDKHLRLSGKDTISRFYFLYFFFVIFTSLNFCRPHRKDQKDAAYNSNVGLPKRDLEPYTKDIEPPKKYVEPYIDMNYWANKQRNEFIENISGGVGGNTGVTSDKVIFKFSESEGKRMYDVESKHLRNFTRQSASYL